jgi:hypothetical protein
MAQDALPSGKPLVEHRVDGLHIEQSLAGEGARANMSLIGSEVPLL